MSLSKKYGVPEATIKMMVSDGVISTSWPGCEEIYYHYKSKLSTCKNQTEAVHVTAEERHVSVGLVYKSIHRFE